MNKGKILHTITISFVSSRALGKDEIFGPLQDTVEEALGDVFIEKESFKINEISYLFGGRP